MGGRGPAVHAELVEDRSQMGVHGTFTQHQPVCYLCVAQPIGYQIEHIDLPVFPEIPERRRARWTVKAWKIARRNPRISIPHPLLSRYSLWRSRSAS